VKTQRIKASGLGIFVETLYVKEEFLDRCKDELGNDVNTPPAPIY